MIHPNPTALVVCAAALAAVLGAQQARVSPNTPTAGTGTGPGTTTVGTVAAGQIVANLGGRVVGTYPTSAGVATIDPLYGPAGAATRVRGRLNWDGVAYWLRAGDRVDLVGGNDATIGGSGGDVYLGPSSTVALWHDGFATTNLVAHYMGAAINLGPTQAITIVTP